MPPKKPHKPKKPKKPKKPHKPKTPKHHGGRGKPNPEKPRKHKPGQKPQKPIAPKRRHRSGSIPLACRPLLHFQKLLDCWLEHNPNVANAIKWEAGRSPQNPPIAWPQWTPSMKTELRQAWLDARAWHANGMTSFAGTVVPDPPPNQDFGVEGGPFFRTVLDGPSQAWPLYLAHVAHCLAAEIGGWVPWTIRLHPPATLEHLLAATQMYVRDRNDGGAWDSVHPGGYVLGGNHSLEKVTPSHPTFTYPFLLENDLVAPTALETIARVLDWCRWNLSHFMGSFTPQNAEFHWQYRGAAPVRRILEGTVFVDPQNPPSNPTPQHWTPGCWGTSAFLRSLLRAVNIPVIPRISGCGHMVPYFVVQKRYLSHGDDPYNALAKAKYPPYPAGLLLLDEATFTSWFPFDPNDPNNMANHDIACQNVGRRVVDLAVTHLSDALVFYYCQDKQNGLNHASGQVFGVFQKHGYTVAQLEATNLWERLAAVAQATGKC